MKKKSIIFAISLISTFLLFAISTALQRKLIHYEPKITCLFLNQNVYANQKLTNEMFVKADIPIATVAATKIVREFSEIEGLYAKDNLYQGQIAISSSFATKENIAVYEVKEGEEKISIKIKNAENGVSYAIKNHSYVNVYATIRTDLAKEFMNESEKLSIGSIEEGYEIITLLQNKQVIECFNSDGERVQDCDEKIIDTIIIAVTHEEAKQINLLREIASFNVTGLCTNQSNDIIEEVEA